MYCSSSVSNVSGNSAVVGVPSVADIPTVVSIPSLKGGFTCSGVPLLAFPNVPVVSYAVPAL